MKELEKIRILFKLKEVERAGRIKERAESSAEHTWACMILAEYFMKRINVKVDELKVLKLLLYHDLIEIESGDVFILDEKAKKHQKENEQQAFNILISKVPNNLTEEYNLLWKEHEDRKTIESRFAHAIDKLEPIIHWLDYREEWRKEGFNEQKLREKKERYFNDFPEIMKILQ